MLDATATHRGSPIARATPVGLQGSHHSSSEGWLLINMDIIEIKIPVRASNLRSYTTVEGSISHRNGEKKEHKH